MVGGTQRRELDGHSETDAPVFFSGNAAFPRRAPPILSCAPEAWRKYG